MGEFGELCSYIASKLITGGCTYLVGKTERNIDGVNICILACMHALCVLSDCLLDFVQFCVCSLLLFSHSNSDIVTNCTVDAVYTKAA